LLLWQDVVFQAARSKRALISTPDHAFAREEIRRMSRKMRY